MRRILTWSLFTFLHLAFVVFAVLALMVALLLVELAVLLAVAAVDLTDPAALGSFHAGWDKAVTSFADLIAAQRAEGHSSAEAKGVAQNPME